jgi:hypothetical protein
MQLSKVLVIDLSSLLNLASASAIPQLPPLHNGVTVGVPPATKGNPPFDSVSGYVKEASHGEHSEHFNDLFHLLFTNAATTAATQPAPASATSP